MEKMTIVTDSEIRRIMNRAYTYGVIAGASLMFAVMNIAVKGFLGFWLQTIAHKMFA